MSSTICYQNARVGAPTEFAVWSIDSSAVNSSASAPSSCPSRESGVSSSSSSHARYTRSSREPSECSSNSNLTSAGSLSVQRNWSPFPSQRMTFFACSYSRSARKSSPPSGNRHCCGAIDETSETRRVSIVLYVAPKSVTLVAHVLLSGPVLSADPRDEPRRIARDMVERLALGAAPAGRRLVRSIAHAVARPARRAASPP